MPTKLISKTLLGALSAAVLAAPAFAGGNCGGGNCAVPVQVMPSYLPEFGPMTVRTENPMGHLRSVNFQRAPNVSITRVHGMAPTAGLSDAPTGFTGGCHPTSTTYCRQNAGRPVQVELSAPAPVVAAPSAPRTVRIGGGYDPSKFTPRVYGDASLVPGIAYLPTSKVVRDPAAAQQVLDSGQTRPQDVVVPGTGTAPHMGMVRQNIQPMPRMMPMAQRPVPMAGAYGGVARDGTYWEKVSGPTAFGDTIATSVICKRQLPRRVINPVIGVPVPVPVPVQQGCQRVGAPMGYQGQPAPGRWVH